LRIDNAKEFTSQEILDFCSENDIILQPVVAIPLSVALKVILAAQSNIVESARVRQRASRFWPDAAVDFTCKKNTLWAKRDKYFDLSTAINRMQPAFAGL